MTDRVHGRQRQPEIGPRVLFFSGGTALNDTAAALKHHTHNSVHLVTPFDSGGSSQVLRQAFDMPAVGDLRSRLVALAGSSGSATLLLSHRLPKEADQASLRREFHQLSDGSHPLMLNVDSGPLDQILKMLAVFSEAVPTDFDFRQASVGNLIIAGGYIAYDHALQPVLAWMSKTMGVLGTVSPIADVNLQVGVELQDGSRVIGQARFTGKESAPITRPIHRIFMADESSEVLPDRVSLTDGNARLIDTADLICFPPGSLFSSVIANLLPKGVGKKVAERRVPKIYVPSLGRDPECIGMTLPDQVGALLAALRMDAGQDCPTQKLVSRVVSCREVLSPDVVDRIARLHGIECLALDIAQKDRPDRYEPERLCQALLSLC